MVKSVQESNPDKSHLRLILGLKFILGKFYTVRAPVRLNNPDNSQADMGAGVLSAITGGQQRVPVR